jgi:hypothetical protein
VDNIGVGAFVNDVRPATKAALRVALRDNPETVTFDATAAIGPRVGEIYRGDDVPEGVRLNVVGPNPYNARAWYATIARGKDGRPRLS